METVGRYRVMRSLGEGGMAEVYLAHDPTLDRDVALKLLHRDAPSDLREEARTLAALRHPGIVTIFEIGEHAGHEFIAMEYLPGRSLRELLAGGAPRGRVIAVLVQVAAAVAAAHRAGILHRDLKPENIVVGDGGEVKVVDFGMARRLAHPNSGGPVTAHDVAEVLAGASGEVADTLRVPTRISPATQTAFGTPAYMAPEILHGEPSSEASDVYSLGVVLHECLAGRRPYAASSLVDLIVQVIEGPPPVLDDPLGPLVAAMLAHEPARRPALDAVVAALARQPRPRRRWWIPAAIAGVAAATAVPVALLLRTQTVATTPVTAAIAIAPIPIAMPSYGNELPHDEVAADLIAMTIARASGAKLTAFAGAPSNPADVVVTGRIDERGDRLYARLELARAGGQRIATITDERTHVELAQLLDALAVDIARAVAPGATIDLRADPARAATLYLKGRPLLDGAQLGAARTYFEQAIVADPDSFDAWYDLAITVFWADVSRERTLATIEQAIRRAPPGPRHELARGLGLLLADRYGEARDVLVPLERAFDADPMRHKQLLYFIGEAYWHDGLHDQGYAYFKRALDVDKRFRLPAIHAMQYAQVRRDIASAQYFSGIVQENPALIEFAGANYVALAAGTQFPFNAWSLLVLGRPVPNELEMKLADQPDSHSYSISRALAAGDRALAAVVFDDAVRTAHAQPAWLDALGEVVVAGGMEREARRLLPVFVDRDKHGRHVRFAIAAAAAFHDPALLSTGALTLRNTQLREASRAEIAGDHARAAELLAALVANPTAGWDYLERAALLRNLRALHRTREVDELCADTLRPAVFRPAFLVLQRACRDR